MKIRIDPLDQLFSKLIRAWRRRCEICGKESTQLHHWKGRRHRSVRYDPDNAWSLCFGCHRKFHEDPSWAVEMQKKRLGLRYDHFILKANGICKCTNSDKKLLEIWIKQELRKCAWSTNKGEINLKGGGNEKKERKEGTAPNPL